MPSFFRSIFVCCAVVALLSTSFGVSPALAAPPPTKADRAFVAARNAMSNLLKDSKRSMQREPWLKLAETFDTLYKKNPGWDDRDAALFRAAAAYDALAKRSRISPDAEEAVRRYVQLADTHSTSNLADDSLMAAAKVNHVLLKDPGAAQNLLTRLIKDYPKGDQFAAAQAYGLKLASESPAARPARESKKTESGEAKNDNAPEVAQSSNTARLTQVDWQSRKNLVKIIIGLDKPTNWVVYSQKPNKDAGRPARLVVDLAATTPDSRIKPGARVSNSLLNRLRIDLAGTGDTRILLDFDTIKRFEVKTETTPYRLVISVSATDAALPKGLTLGQKAERNTDGGVSSGRVPANMAAQLGLSVRTVVLDAGHGGNDPGTDHNGVTEKDLTLSMTRRIGPELEKMGYNVRYTRTKDDRMELAERSRLANSAKGDVFVSIHVNASDLPTSQGFETYFLDFASSNAAARLAAVENSMISRNLGDMEKIMADLMLGARTQESRRLASAIQSSTLSHLRKRKLNIRDGGLRSAPFHVLLGSGMPGVLVEVGYCTNTAEAARLKQDGYLDALARGIANGVDSYAKKLSRS